MSRASSGLFRTTCAAEEVTSGSVAPVADTYMMRAFGSTRCSSITACASHLLLLLHHATASIHCEPHFCPASAFSVLLFIRCANDERDSSPATSCSRWLMAGQRRQPWARSSWHGGTAVRCVGYVSLGCWRLVHTAGICSNKSTRGSQSDVRSAVI